MKILLTGASSFTGYWFARELAARGHHVVATFRRGSADAYADEQPRGRRVAGLVDCIDARFGVTFGSLEFQDLIRAERDLEVFCHHAADVTDYKSPEFDVAGAVANNTHNIREVLRRLTEVGCGRVAATGSVFEGGEGAGSPGDGLPDFSPYGLSKRLSFEVLAYQVRDLGLKLGKFVIPNPFGPLEEPRFTTYLARNWLAGKVPAVNTPDYVRDNIHVSLLAKAYAAFLEGLTADPGIERSAPSGYVESQGAFAERLAREMRPRLGVPCALSIAAQADFSEPLIRRNTGPVDPVALGWEERAAWDILADYYASEFRDS